MTRTQFQCWFHLCIYYKSITGSLYAALGVLPNLKLKLSHKEPKQQTPRSCARVVYIAGDTLRHQPMGAGHMTVLQFRGPTTFCVLQWCHPMLTRT